MLVQFYCVTMHRNMNHIVHPAFPKMNMILIVSEYITSPGLKSTGMKIRIVCYKNLLLQELGNYLKSRNVSASCKALITSPALALLFCPFWFMIIFNKLWIFRYFGIEHH